MHFHFPVCLEGWRWRRRWLASWLSYLSCFILQYYVITRPMNIRPNQLRNVPGKIAYSYLLSSPYTEKILWAGHAAADQHDCIGPMDFRVTGGPRVAGNKSPTGAPRDTLLTQSSYRASFYCMQLTRVTSLALTKRWRDDRTDDGSIISLNWAVVHGLNNVDTWQATRQGK